MKKSVQIAFGLVLFISCSVLAQDTKTQQEPVAEKLTLQQSLSQERPAKHSQTIGEVLNGTGLSIGRKPMLIVDGVIPTADDKTNPMDTKVSDIVSIKIVKNPIELAVYGPEGANGVILVTTKFQH